VIFKAHISQINYPITVINTIFPSFGRPMGYEIIHGKQLIRQIANLQLANNNYNFRSGESKIMRK
jgi:hypothetical protein